jgi:vacuolar protein sorting-associated protein 13A/C
MESYYDGSVPFMVCTQQICVPHPKYPSTRVAIRLPSLGFQFSPARYHRLMQVINVFSSQSSKGGNDNGTSSIRPWDPADFEGPLSVLSWKGVGHREATWERYHGALAGPFLYLLESPSVQSYKSYHSLLGKKVFNVPPESVGAVKNVLAVCDSSQLDSKVVESANALLLRFDNDAARENWQARLLGAIYHGSSPAAVAGIIKSGKSGQKDPKEMVTEAAEGHEHQQKMNPAEQETFFLTGVLDELKFIVSNSLDVW